MWILAVNTLFAQGEAAVPFLLITPGARNGGLGEAGVALVNDANAIYWNPAGLAFQYENPETDYRNEITLMHSKWLPQFNFDDLYYDYLAGRFYVGDLGMLGGSITFLNLGKNVWTDETGEELGTFDSFEYAVTLSYATKLASNTGIGINLKLIQSNLTDFEVKVGTETGDGQATAFAVDLGMLWTPDYEFLDNKLNVGFNLANFGPRITYIDADQADPLPTNLRAGLSYHLMDDGFNRITLIYDINRLLVVKDTSGTSDNVFKAAFYSSWTEYSFRESMKKFTHAFGLEYNYGTLIALRTGYFYEDPQNGDRKFITFGAGLAFNMFTIDLSYLWTWTDEDHPLSDTMRFSIGVKF
ncbi:MAG: type IX secretion system outer membrane channel protein PorV [Calditrichaceae bacterium]